MTGAVVTTQLLRGEVNIFARIGRGHHYILNRLHCDKIFVLAAQ